MTRSRSKLADILDALVGAGRVALTETRDAIVVYQLQGNEAKRLLAQLSILAWADLTIADEGGELDAADIDDDDVGITIRVQKPNIPTDVEAILTRTGLSAALDRADLGGKVWVQGLNGAFETLSVRFAPWDDAADFTPLFAPPPPRSLVRVLDSGRRFPTDLGRWLLRDPDVEISGPGIEPWRRMAVERLGQCFANEIEQDGRLLFRGPPPTRFAPEAATLVEEGALKAMERAAIWAFDNPRETENRHLLFATEIARTALKSGNVCDLAAVMMHALEGARIAYSFGVAQQSRDTLKSLSDLRKAVTDETSKLTETTRGLAAAITGSVVGNIGIIIARLALPAESNWVPGAAVAIGIVLVLYVASTIFTGWQYLTLQDDLRAQWRDRLYRFLEKDEYEAMVTSPVSKAERTFWVTAIIGSIMSLILFGAVWHIAGSA